MGSDLKEKYRPKTFDDFYGNDEAINTLIALLDRKEGVPPAILFTGGRGCGKTTLAGIIKRELNIHDRDFVEMNNADDRGIDAMRALKRNIAFPPNGKMRIVFLDEVHKLTNDAQNSILKMLEVPPDHTRFLLATTDPQMLIQTVRSRCKTIALKPLTILELKELIGIILKKEGVSKFPKDMITVIAEQADGSPREAIDLLDTCLAVDDPKDMERVINQFVANQTDLMSLCRQIINPGATWENISKIIQGLHEEAESARHGILGYMSKIILKGETGSDRVAELMEYFLPPMIWTRQAGLILACWKAFNHGK